MKNTSYSEVFTRANISTHSKIFMMGVIKCYITILSERSFRFTRSVDINIKMFWILIFWLIGYYIPYFQLLSGTGPRVLRSLWVICSNNHRCNWVFRADLYKFIIYGFLIFLYNKIESILVISFYNSFKLLLYDELFSNMHQDI